ncbi:hypothetical protein ACFQU1_06360 [Chelatococcus sp. GCM10030263]|uniref:hypothetical protein n=1 Tax=Chelatococcus sp. GCM10030263 TaxID=3273387 RepID=UPI003605C4BE
MRRVKIEEYNVVAGGLVTSEIKHSTKKYMGRATWTLTNYEESVDGEYVTGSKRLEGTNVVFRLHYDCRNEQCTWRLWGKNSATFEAFVQSGEQAASLDEADEIEGARKLDETIEQLRNGADWHVPDVA